MVVNFPIETIPGWEFRGSRDGKILQGVFQQIPDNTPEYLTPQINITSDKFRMKVGEQEKLGAFAKIGAQLLVNAIKNLYSAPYETLEQGALAHGIDPEKLVKQINKGMKQKQHG